MSGNVQILILGELKPFQILLSLVLSTVRMLSNLLEYIFLVAGKALHWNGKARMRSFFSERNFFFSAINSFFFEIWKEEKWAFLGL